MLRYQRRWAMQRIAEHFEVHRKTIQRWLRLYRDKESRYWNGTRFRKARPRKYGIELRERIRQLRLEVPSRSAVTIRRMLRSELTSACPSVGTTRRVLRELGLSRAKPTSRRNYIKFERDVPNEMWQIDFKGYEYFGDLGKLHLLAILDDRSRFVVAARWFTSQEESNVILLLREAFEAHGLPNEILSDNGTQFKNAVGEPATRYVKLLRLLGVKPIFHRVGHPESKGKLERWFGTVKSNFSPEARALLERQPGPTPGAINDHFQPWLKWYNFEHEHSSLERQSPARVYIDHPKRIDRPLEVAINWDQWTAAMETRKVTKQGIISVDGRKYILPSGHAKSTVQVRRLDGILEVYAGEVLVETFNTIPSTGTSIEYAERKTSKDGTFRYKRKIYNTGIKNAHKVIRVQEAANGKEFLIYHDGELLARLVINDGTSY